MLARRALASLPLAMLGLSCAQPPPASPPPAVASLPSASPSPSPERDEPGVVRCGVDDRPRPIGEHEPKKRTSALDRSLLGDRIADFPAPPGAPPPPLPSISLTAGVPRLGGSPSPQVTRGLEGDASAEVCAEQADPGDSGPLELSVEIASTGEPLRVRSSRGQAPSPYVRCLMERACQIKVSPEASGKTVALPLALKIDPPPPPPPPPPPLPSRVEVALRSPPAMRSGVPATLEAVLLDAGSGCLTRDEPIGGKPLRLRVTLTPITISQGEGPAERGMLGFRAMAERPQDQLIIDLAPQGPVPPPLARFSSCVIGRLHGTSLGVFPKGAVKRRVEQVTLSIVASAP